MSTRHNSIDALRERYQRSRLQQSINNKGSTELLSSSPGVPTTVIEEEEEDDDDEEEDDEEEEEDDDDYSMNSSSSSIPDENINFDLVYALHTFVATVDGQASVVKGDAMTLLDDTNSYWWLIRALKASEVGYIPAENIETPFERLARLNKHRNVQVTSLDQLQHCLTVKKKIRKNDKKVKVSKELQCQLQIILTDQDDKSIYEETFEKWNEDMSSLAYRENEEQVESEDEDDEEQARITAEAKKDMKYTPLLNPDFNKPIRIVKKSSSTSALKPLPKLIVVEEKKPAAVASPTTEQHQQQPAQKVVTGLKRLLSIGNNSSSNNKNNKPVDLGISSASLQQEKNNNQYHVLRIFSGNINVGAMFNTVAVTPDMNADQLLKIALQKFHIPLLEENNSVSQQRPRSIENGIEYYLTVKSMDGDEITLEPQDKPLAIFESLSDHLTTPMPSLTHIKRLSMEQPTIKVTRVGVSKARQRAKARFGEDSVIRFSLHKRIKRNTAAGQIYVKISYYAPVTASKMSSSLGLIRKSSLLRPDQQQMLLEKQQERIDKLVAISTTTLISDLTQIALEKFHMTNQDKSLYYMCLSFNGKETPLMANKIISDILSDSNLMPKGTVEKLFVLRQNVAVIPTLTTSSIISEPSESTNRFVRYILKQDQQKDITTMDHHDVSSSSSTGNVLKRLDQAIQSLENDKRQLDKSSSMIRNHHSDNNLNATTTTKRMVPVRSNSLSAMSNYRSSQKIVPVHRAATPDTNNIKRFASPVRSSSLKISGDVFDSTNKSSISNMDDLEMELKRIASSH